MKQQVELTSYLPKIDDEALSIEEKHCKQHQHFPPTIAEKPIEFDDVLFFVGEFGPYQLLLFFLTAPFCFFLAFIDFSQVFITLVPDHWCHVPQLNTSGLSLYQR